jgi:predicted DNA-binding ribbon-helix-helix protein
MADPIIHTVSLDEAARLDAIASEEELHKAELIARLERQDRATEEDSLSGQLRRAVADSLIGPERLAAEIDVDLSAFVAFQAGDAELPFGAFERLARRMGLA